jgi:hypothetical protein
MRWYGYPALGSLLLCQYLLFEKVEPVYTFFTPIQWWNYIFLMDAIVWGRQRKSLITDRPVEFLLMLVLSNVCWLVFEAYNLLLGNWYYTNLAEHTWQRMLGAGTAFATIFPGIFLTADFLEGFGLFGRRRTGPREIPSVLPVTFFAAGLAAAIFPIVFPSKYVFGLVWLGYFFLLDPVNYWLKNSSILGDWEEGNRQRFWLLLIAGAICGFLWELWNFWAGAKWIYTVPFTEKIRYFEMPVLGLLGFPPFALECFAMYHFTRSLLSYSFTGKPLSRTGTASG